MGGKHSIPSLNIPISQIEYDSIKKKNNNDKKPGDDRVSYEMLKRGGNLLDKAILALYNLLFEMEIIPIEWRTAIFTPLYKKGSPFNTDNYRPIGLLSTIFKNYERICDTRVRDIIAIRSQNSVASDQALAHILC